MSDTEIRAEAVLATVAEDISAVDMARSLASGQFRPASKPDLGSDADSRAETAEVKEAVSSTLAAAAQSGLSIARDSGTAYFHSVARIGLQVAEALVYAHEQGTLHRDIFKAIEKDPGHRYTSAAALAEDLRRFLQERPITARRPRPLERLVRWARKNPVLAALATTVFVLLAAVAAVSSKLAVEINDRANAAQRSSEQALQANAALEAKQRTLERVLYATSLRAAQSAWEADNVRLCRDTLDGASGLIEWPNSGVGRSSPNRIRLVEKFRSHQTSLRVAAFDLSREGTVARLASDGTIRIDSTVDGSESLTLDIGAADLRALAIVADGSRLVTAGPGPTVTVWDTRPNPSVRTFVDGASPAVDVLTQNPAARIAVSPDGRRVACAGGTMPNRIRDVETGRVLLDFGGSAGTIQTIAYSPDGRYIAAGGTDNLIHIWEAATAHEVSTLKANSAPVGRIAFSPDGTTLASAGLGDLVRVWEVATGLVRFSAPGDASATVVAFSPDGSMLASDGFRELRLTDNRRRETIRRAENALPDEVIVTALAFSPSGKELAGACTDDTIRIWDVAELRRAASGAQPRRVLRGHGGRVTGVAYSPERDR